MPVCRPVPMEVPDLPKLPFKMVNGVKEFELRCTAVKREFLPGYPMDVWGYNGTMPGPLVEANQGDRVRFVVHHDLPEPTTIHWHGFELPVQYDGVPGLTQMPIPPGGKIYLRIRPPPSGDVLLPFAHGDARGVRHDRRFHYPSADDVRAGGRSRLFIDLPKLPH